MKKKIYCRNKKLQNPEVLVTMGAGDIGLEIKKLKKKLHMQINWNFIKLIALVLVIMGFMRFPMKRNSAKKTSLK